ncbi:ABC transporter family substrate-binding protein [Streptomyces sp. HNM0574]|uniref:ABC transporter family substrate-binding protein n=1 Tax=Streptomyces sp. HNM0574 TaxID=2714954 RepID=UPI00146B757E|nr:ABC transporter family substrate-binding protein [Streptomyces sp. HNM0574]NLU67335.1 ABC transporter family substrate-binding protein [Streptomyces sp. HNM0574]
MPAIDTASRRAVALIVAGALLPLAACSSSSDDSSGSGASGAARDVRDTERAQVASGGTLKWAIDEVPSTLNAFQPSADAATDRIAGATLPSLFRLDEKARPEPDPAFVESAEITEREPKQKVVYKLNPKARWSDGRAIGAEDFAAQAKALNGRNSSYWSARNTGYERIQKVSRGKEAHTVEVTFAKPYADWQSLFTPLYPKSVTGSPKAFNEGVRTALPVSAGPFRVKTVSADSGGVTLERNPKWWGDRAKLDRIELKAVPREKRQAALLAGELDLAEVNSSTAQRVSGANSSGKNGDGKNAEGKNGDTSPGGPAHAAPASAALAGVTGVAGGRAAASLGAWAEQRMTPQARAEAEETARVQREKRRQYLAEQQKLEGFSVRKALGPAYTQLALNGAEGPLSDERVRRAVARALDRNSLAKEALSGTGLPHEPLGSHLRMRDQDGYADNSAAIGGEDIESAQSLLADAGWTGGPAEPGKPNPGPAKAGEEKSGKGAKGEDSTASGAASATGAQAGPQRPPYRMEAEKSAVRLSAAQIDRVTDKPLSLAASASSQHAGLLTQAARARLAAAEESGSESEIKAATSALKQAGGVRSTADELRLLAGGEAEAVRMKEGKPLALRFVLPSGPGSDQVRQTGEKIASMLNGIGIRTQIKQVPAESFFKDHVAAGDYDLALFSWPATAYPATDARPIFAKPRAAGDGSLLVEQNYTRVGTNQIDQLFDEAASELDEGARKDLLKKADARIWAAAGSVPLYQRPQLVATKDSVVNAGAFGFQTPRYQDIGYQK